MANGLIADGVTDCSSALQTIINSSAGHLIELAPGTYYMGTTSIGLPEGTRLIGRGKGLNRFGTNGVVLKWSSTMANRCLVVNGSNTWIQNIAINVNGGTGTGLAVLAGFEFRAENLRVINSGGHGMEIKAASNARYEGIFVDNCGSSTLPAVLISSTSASINTLDIGGMHIERQPNVALQIGPTTMTGDGSGDIVPEFVRFTNLHIEAVTDNGGSLNTDPLVRIKHGRSISFANPYIYGGAGPLLRHEQLATVHTTLGGVQIIGGTLLGNEGGSQPATLIDLASGNEFSINGTRLDRCSGAAITVAAGYGDRVFVSPSCIFTSRVGSRKSDARTGFDYADVIANPVRIQGHSSTIVTAKTTPTPSTELAGSTGAPTLGTGSSDTIGSVKFGSGTSTAIGQKMFTLTFGTAYTQLPVVLLTPNNNDTRLLGLYVARTTTGFDVYAGNAPTPSQPPTQYEVSYYVMGTNA